MKYLATSLTSRKLSLVSVPLLVLSLGACATPSFKSEVTRFQELPAPTGQSFTIRAADPELKGGLEFAQYASLVEKQMARIGYVPASSPETADMTVSLSYDIDRGQTKYRRSGFYDPFYASYGRGFYGRYGYWGRSRFYRHGRFGHRRFRHPAFYRFGFYDPFFFGGTDLDRITVYTSQLNMNIDRNADGKRLFEGKAEAMSRSRRLGYLVPNLVEAIFTDFPGESGETVRISVAPEKKTVKRVN